MYCKWNISPLWADITFPNHSGIPQSNDVDCELFLSYTIFIQWVDWKDFLIVHSALYHSFFWPFLYIFVFSLLYSADVNRHIPFTMSCFGCLFGCFTCLIKKCIQFWKRLFGFGKSDKPIPIIVKEQCTQTVSPPNFRVPGRESLRVGLCDSLHPLCYGKNNVRERCCVPVYSILTRCPCNVCAHRQRRKRIRKRGTVIKIIDTVYPLSFLYNQRRVVKVCNNWKFENWFSKYTLSTWIYF